MFFLKSDYLFCVSDMTPPALHCREVPCLWEQ